MHGGNGSKPSRFSRIRRERMLAARVVELEAALEAARREGREAREQLERVAVPLVALSPDARVRWMNQRAVDLLGRPKLEVVGRAWITEVVPEPERARGAAFYGALLSSSARPGEAEHAREATSDVVELPVMTARGVRIVAWHHSLFRDDRGEISFVFCAGEDVTEAHRALSELELLGRAIEDASDAVMVTDRDGVVTYVNPAFERASGRTREEATGKITDELLPMNRTDARHEAFLDALRHGRAWSGRLEGRRRDGAAFDEDATVSPVSTPKGDLMGYVVVSRDMTEQAKMEARLRMVDRIESIGRFAGGIAHDFNNLLTVILGICEMALPELPASSPLHRDLGDILDAAQRAALLTGQLLTFSRKQVTQPEPLRLGVVLDEMSAMLDRLLGARVRLTIDVDASLPWVVMDRSQLEQVLLNLVVNAKDAMADGGELELRCRRLALESARARRLGLAPGSHAEIEVRDTGVGMDQHTLAKIFEPFFTTKGVGQGTGLGLSTVYGVIQQAGGQVEVESELGRGTTFRIYLPAVELTEAEAAAPETAIRAPSSPGGHETVLLVEDDAGVREMAARILRGRGYHVLTAPSREQALLVAAGHLDRIDLLLCDVVLGDGHGRDVVEALRSKGRHVPVILMSGYSTEDVLAAESNGGPRRSAALAQRDPFKILHKPFHPDELAHAVRCALGEEAASEDGVDPRPPSSSDHGLVEP
jgi:PAS domain S-box-containing protein